jgi:hypothetical protein
VCAYCGGRRSRCAPVADIGRLIRDGIARAYTDVANECLGYDPEEGSYTIGDPSRQPSILDVMEETAFADRICGSDISERLASDLLEASGPRPFEDADDLGGIHDPIALRGGEFWREDAGVHAAWDAFRLRVLHHARFFDVGPKEASRRELLMRIARLASRTVTRIAAGTTLYRARKDPPDAPLPPDLDVCAGEIGPAPPKKATGNRMSPPGISYAYVSEDEETCRVEVAETPGERLWVGAFVTMRRLRIVDLSGRGRLRCRSMYDPRYVHSERWHAAILKEFADEIAQPIRGEDAAVDYVPTQVLAEFLRTRGYDGIRYGSAKRQRGINLVLFFGPPELAKALDSWDARFDAAAGAAAPFDTVLRLVQARDIRADGSATAAPVATPRSAPPSADR